MVGVQACALGNLVTEIRSKAMPHEVFRHAGVTLELPSFLIKGEPRQGLVEGWYDLEEVSQITCMLQPDDIVLELGAGIGFTSTKIAQHSGIKRVVAVEADPRLIQIARRTYELNRVSVHLINAVVAQDEGRATFHIDPEFWGSSTFSRPGGKAIELHSVSLRSLLQEVQPTVLVVDVEGAESYIFDRTSVPTVRAIALKLHPDIIGWEGVAKTFAALSWAGFFCNSSKRNVAIFTRTSSASDIDEADLLRRSQYFDSAWYLANYRDVDDAGINPIRHYLDAGASEGRNPSAIFDTRWYQERNPEATALGINPLMHYLRFGAARGSDPHPFAMLRRKIEPMRQEMLDKLFSLFSELHGQSPGATNDHNWIENREKWACYFIAHGIAALRNRNILRALEEFKRSAQVCPEFSTSWLLYAHAFRTHNCEALTIFDEAFKNGELLVAHVSCKQQIERARSSALSFFDPSGRIKNLIVVGSETADDKFKFDRANSVLTVPAGDSYEHLSMKVHQMVLFLALSSANCSVLKVDDDVHCRELTKLYEDFKLIIASADYGGVVTQSDTQLRDCHFWHFGKCDDPKINHRPDGFFFLQPYARGLYYWLSPSCLNLLGRAAVIHERYFQFETYEDRAIGLVLSYYGVRPHQARLTHSSLKSLK